MEKWLPMGRCHSVRNFFSLLICLLIAPTASADRVRLDNGDQLTGEILYMDADTLVFNASKAGRVDIQWKTIQSLESDEPIKVDIKGKEKRVVRTRLHSGPPGKVRFDDGEEVALSDLNALLRTKKRKRDWLFEGNLDFDTDIKRDRDDKSNNLHAEIDTRIVDIDWRHIFRGDYTYEKEEEVETERNYNAEYNIDYFMNDAWYWRVHVRTERNYFSDNKRDTEYGTGPGYQFWDDEQGRFGVNVGYLRYRYARDYEDETELPDRLRFNAVGTEWDFKHEFLGTDLEIYATGNLYLPDDYDVDYLVLSDTGVRYRLGRWVRLSFDFEHDGLKKGNRTESNDRYGLGIGVEW